MVNTDSIVSRKWRPRISLLSALLLMTIAGMTLVIVQLWREVGPLREEVRLLRNETGQLYIDDSHKIHVVALGPDELSSEGKWKWRVYLPEGSVYKVHAIVAPTYEKDRLPAPKPNDDQFPIGPGEHMLHISMRDYEGTQMLNYFQEIPGASMESGYETERQINLEWPTKLPGYVRGLGYSGILVDMQQQFPVDKPVVLLRLFPEYSPDGDSRKDAPETSRLSELPKPPTRTFYLWIEPTPIAAK